jgi:hypothetical protein
MLQDRRVSIYADDAIVVFAKQPLEEYIALVRQGGF